MSVDKSIRDEIEAELKPFMDRCYEVARLMMKHRLEREQEEREQAEKRNKK